MIQNKDDIKQALNQRFDHLLAWFEQHPAEKFVQGPEGKWTAGQQVEHLIMSTKPLNMALRMPKIQIRAMFGKPNRTPREYEGVVKRYQERLAEAYDAPERFQPKEPKMEDKTEMLESLNKKREKLVKIIDKWEEEKLDNYLLPHPLLGKMTIREMLFFTVYHTEHHTKSLETQYT